MPDDKDTILIKRYASRRLYNTETSDYVTLDEVAGYIRDGKDIQIVDRKTGDDLTRQYLLQIITDYETRGENVLPINVLTDIVRSYNQQARNFIPDFLSHSYAMLKQQQQQFLGTFQQNVSDAMPKLSPMTGLEKWQEMQSEFFNQMMKSWVPTGTEAEAEEEPLAEPQPTKKKSSRTTKSNKSVVEEENEEKQAEIEKIKKQLSALQSKLQDL